MKLLPAEQQSFAYENGLIIAGLHEDRGYRRYSVFVLRDGDALASADNLECLVIDSVDRPAVAKL